MNAGADFSPCRAYRYRLWRLWSTAKLPVVYLMLNPSTADATQTDQTLLRCEERARRWGYGGVVLVNLFALTATDPRVMKAHPHPVGPDNDAAILDAASRSPLIVAGWGNHGTHRGRAAEVAALLGHHGHDLHALRVTKSGQPQHPLYLPYGLTPQEFHYPTRRPS